MKKTITMLGAALFLALTLSFNAKAMDINPDVNSKVKNAFTEHFAAASNVSWYTEKDNKYMARFDLGDTRMTAYFDKKGHLLLTSRAIKVDELPLSIAQELREKYAGNKIRYITEMAAGGATTYVVTLETANSWTQLMVDNLGNFTTVQQFKKA